VANIVDVQVAEDHPAHRLIAILDYFFTGLFTIELLINLFAHWLVPFFCSGWNLVCHRPSRGTTSQASLPGESGIGTGTLGAIITMHGHERDPERTGPSAAA
jgi:hypothetical protein